MQSPSQDEAALASGRRRLALAVLLGLLAATWGGAAVFLVRSRAAALDAAFGWAEAQAAIAGQTVSRAFELVNALHDLIRIRQALLRKGDTAGGRAIEAHLVAIAADDRFGVVQVGVVGPDGIMPWGSAPAAVGTYLADRDHVRDHAFGGERGLAISRPVIGRTTGRWSVQVTRALEGPDGQFDGVAIVSLDPIALSATLQKQLDGVGRMVVVRRLQDGSLILRGRDPEQTLGRDPSPDHALVIAARAAPSGRITYSSSRDGRNLLTAYQVPPGLPLVVAVAFELSKELRPWGQQRNAVLAGAAALSLLAVTLFTLWSARERVRAGQQRLARERIAAAEALARQRAEVLAVMAHEIRTPLTGVLGFGELLAAGDLPPEQRRHAELVVETGRVLLSVVNDVLDLAKIEAGRVSIELQPFEPAEVLRQSLALNRTLATGKGLRLALELDPALPAWLLGDATRLRQILGNFLSNAVKFTERGGITLRARVLGPAGPEAVRLRLEVEDTGIGIPPEAQLRLFGMFEQAESGRRLGGAGLGLAICRRLVEAMGGSIGVASEIGRGSTIWCELPLRSAAAPEKAEAPAIGAGPSLDVLVADDVATNRALIRAYLTGAGHRVTLAEDGIAAVAAAQERAFDVILMDVNMPGLDGLEATRRLRLGDGPNARTPIIALTAGTSREEREQAEAAGMTLHLAKPASRATLLQALQRVAAPAEQLSPG
ncbi:hybrid sensor histidine kinase/response regulator [Paracraurococcus lichenis]|uniref:histidine kinase n=1 Tax=Paracraurococcus lichenis TaxID=3064888 RepID=A0ABT9DXG9_9PROT|nr:hybrid sensor histidine kinase/response regulator [Paracraurococcus sp. LOR1-02]MDO9708592.1 ATP-binding protein [Paracraurococcus sp. LOR1-02]